MRVHRDFDATTLVGCKFQWALLVQSIARAKRATVTRVARQQIHFFGGAQRARSAFQINAGTKRDLSWPSRNTINKQLRASLH